MTGLNWITARNLAISQTRAIRRAGWNYWLLYRFKVWIISTLDLAGNEVRRVVQAHDFRDSEFLAKDWTDEPWAGGSTPPCTTLPPALAPIANVTGGLGIFTLGPNCGGAGGGGGVPPTDPPADPTGGAGDSPHRMTASFSAIATDAGHAYAVADDGSPIAGFYDGRAMPALTPDGGFCWRTFPETPRYVSPVYPSFAMCLSFVILRMESTSDFDDVCEACAWISWSGHDFSAVPLDTFFPTMIADATPQARVFSGFRSHNISNFFMGLFVPESITPVPGDTVTARLAYLAGSSVHVAEAVNLSYTFPPYCYGYPPIGGGGM